MEHVPDVDFGGFDVRPLSWPVSPERLSFQSVEDTGTEDRDSTIQGGPRAGETTGPDEATQTTAAGTTSTAIDNATAFDTNHYDTTTPFPTTTTPGSQSEEHLTQGDTEDKELQRAIALSEQTAREDEERRERQRRRVLAIFEKGRARSIEIPEEEFVKIKPSLKDIPLPAYDGSGYPSYKPDEKTSLPSDGQPGLGDGARGNIVSPVCTNATPIPAQPSPPSTTAPAPVAEYPASQGRFKAIYDFEGQSNGELGLKTGDVVLIVQREANGWWLARQPHSGASGWVPSAYLVEAKEAPPPPPPRQDRPIPPTAAEEVPDEPLQQKPQQYQAYKPDAAAVVSEVRPPEPTGHELIDTDETEQWHDADEVPATGPPPVLPGSVADTPPGPGRYAGRNTIQLPLRQPSSTYRPERGPPAATSSTNETASRIPLTLNVTDVDRDRTPVRSGTKLEIRDTSRSRGTPKPVKAPTGEVCDSCEEICLQTSYCNVCRLLFCEPCWAQQIQHKKSRQGKGSMLHEKTEHSVAKKVQDVLTPELTHDAREKLHEKDIDTTWFGVAREESELPLFRDYGRYANLITVAKEMRLDLPPSSTTSIDGTDTLYPSLVSFVGQTGAGKSTLIKLLIDLKMKEGDPNFPTPVTGAAGRDVSTSEDVHLYLDPDSSLSTQSRAPLLFADCEGLEGGERDPVGAILKKKHEKALKGESGTAGRRQPGLKHTSERELVWADTPKKRSREFAVAHLYPRLLYTFSDVIVFVLKNPRVIEGVLERLIDWAQAALEKSSNQPVLPHAIIALNASEYDIDQNLWDVDFATQSLLESLSRTVFHNATFKKYAQFWRERDRQIETVEHLVLSYYSSIRVVRIPTDGRPNLIQGQVEKLWEGIHWASKHARERKADLRMLLDADEFQPYLQVAFDHFAENLNTPFDFVQASFSHSPIPHDFGGNILKLSIQVMECWKDIAKGHTIFEELSFLVASCIMLDAARNRYRGHPDEFFPNYLQHIENALENFCDRHWPCEFTSSKGRCVNVRSGHGAKGHQLKSGKLLADGEYQSSFTFHGYREQFQIQVYRVLLELSKRVRIRAREGIPEEQAAAEIHEDWILPHFIEHAARGDAKAFISHTVCFACLFEPPEHALPCGHVLCTRCLKTFGKVSLSRFVEIARCPLERKESRFRTAWRVHLKPASCGVRVLTLDGGGIRGIVELETLKQIEKELGDGVSVQSFFDLIVGTSTGGIIALGLTARNWTVTTCAQNFEMLCRKAFTLRKGAGLPGIGWFVENYNHSRYETQPLQEALMAAFTDEQRLFGGEREARDAGSLDVKVAVTATTAAGNSVVLANYNRLSIEKLSYQFQRPEKPHAELKTWEAARATSAAPQHFKPLCHEASKQTLLDGGIYHNNPINIADQERKLIWPSHQDVEPDVVVSIGTAYCKYDKKRTALDKWRKKRRGVISHGTYLKNIAADHVHSSLDSEKTWRDFINVKRTEDRKRYIRINPALEEPVPKLDDVEKMNVLKDATRHIVGDSPEVKMAALRLVAACFYFDTFGDVKEIQDATGDLYEVQGYFHCRFIAGHEISELGKFIKRKAVAGHEPHFLIKEQGNDDFPPQEVLLDERDLNRMITSQMFNLRKQVIIRRPNKSAVTEISLCLTRDTSYPLSGFPRKLHGGKSVASANRSAATKINNSFRWAGRSGSQQEQRRRDWKAPIMPAMEKQDIIERYSEPSHLLGSATEADLMDTNPKAAEAQGHLELEVDGFGRKLARYGSAEGARSSSSLPRSELFDTQVGERIELPTTEVQDDRYYIARDDWTPEQPNSSIYLSLRRADLVKIKRTTTDGWWLGRVAASPKEGWMPSSWLLPAGQDAHIMFSQHVPGGASNPSELQS